MKALSIRQPWAWAILHAGKDVENRAWNPGYPGIVVARKMIERHERFLIHAGLGMTRGEYDNCLDTLHAISRHRPFPEGMTLPAYDDLPRGGIVGSARLTDVVAESASPFFFGPMALVLVEPKACNLIKMKGALGFFDVSNERVRSAQDAGFL